MSQITGQLYGVDNTAVVGSVEFQLCGYGSKIPTLGASPGGRLVVITECDGSGHFTVNLKGNDTIVPANTYYTVTTRNENGDAMQCNAYMFADATNYDLGTTTPIVPPQPLPPNIPIGLLVVPYAANLLFDGTQANGFKVVLNGNLYATIKNMRDKCLIPFTFEQDSVGGHVVTWSTDFHNTGDINLNPLWTSVYVFASDDDGTLNAAGPVSYIAP